MKIRIDFVSNSSSSSFVLWGASFDKDKLEQKLKDANAISAKDVDEDYYGSCVDQWIDEQKIFDYSEYVIGDSEVVFGLKPTKMKNDETLMQFKLRIFAKLAEANLPVNNLDDIQLYQGVDVDGDIIFD